MKKFLGFLFLVLLGVGGYFGYSFYYFPLKPYGNQALIEVKKGMGVPTVVQEIHKAGLTNHPKWLEYYFRYRGVASVLKVGEYEFGPGATPDQMAEKLIKGERLRRNFTIPEGYSVRDIAKHLGEKGIVDPNTFMTLAWAPDAASKYGLDGTTLEGYLFPDTYEYTKEMKEAQILAMMVANFKKKLAEKLMNIPTQLGLSKYQALTLASIVEKETGKAEERPLIAGVFYNRLRVNMPLATDPTIIYGIANYDGNIRKIDLETDGPYNTYLRPGLPPTPIANPGLKSIEAVLNPAPSDYLYFVSKGDGSHQFSRTLEEHNAAVQLYQLQKSGTLPASMPMSLPSTLPTSLPSSRPAVPTSNLPKPL